MGKQKVPFSGTQSGYDNTEISNATVTTVNTVI